MFDEAETAHAMLLFDEADSLFAKRTEVKSANDRYANLEVNYLLQRMETFDGITLLTTNLEQGIDEAFKRRLRFRVGFELPEDAGARAAVARMFPPQAPLAPDIDWDLLARAVRDGRRLHQEGRAARRVDRRRGAARRSRPPISSRPRATSTARWAGSSQLLVAERLLIASSIRPRATPRRNGLISATHELPICTACERVTFAGSTFAYFAAVCGQYC